MTKSDSRNSFLSTPLTLGECEFGQWDELIAVHDIPNSPKIPTSAPIPLPPLLDVMQLEHIRYRREILDWRDGSIVKLSSTGRDALRDFSGHMNDMLEEVPRWRRVLSQSANVVLQDTFNMLVRSKIRNQAVRARVLLVKMLALQGCENAGIPALIDKFPDSELSCIQEYGFKPSNHDEILSALESLVMGDQGIVQVFQYQIIKITEKLIEKPLQ